VNNSLIMGTPHEQMKLIAYVEGAEFAASRTSDTWFREMFENYKRANGRIYSSADLEKLNLERRPAFVYNLFRPILLQLAGNYRQNLGKIELFPKTPGDIEIINILNDLTDHALLTANNFEIELTKAYINACIGRVGWIYTDYRYDIDDEGMFWYEAYNPFRVLFDSEKGTSNQKKWNYEIDRGYYTTEEIRNLFAQDDMDMYDEITEKSKLLLGESELRNKQIMTMIERVWGLEVYYQGKDVGYDSYSRAFSNLQMGNSEYLDYNTGRFKVIDFHERRSEQIITAYFPNNEKKVDITDSINRLVRKDSPDKKSVEYRNAIAAFRDRTIQQGFGEPVIKRELINQIYQTAVCPALNMVLANEPYTVQNGNFKLIPNFCFEMDQEVLEWKSYIDDLVDPVRGINLNMNTMQTYIMKTATGETWYEEDALLEHEDDFVNSTINGYKKVKKGKLEKIKKVNPPALPAGHVQMTQILEEMVKKISTIRDNAVGTKEQANESGRLFQARVAQTDILQLIPQDNVVTSLKVLGENCIDNLIHYITPGRAIRMIGDESDPYWIVINEDSVEKLFYKDAELVDQKTISKKISTSKYDVGISKVPYGEAAKAKEFEQMVMIARTFIEMGRPDLVVPELILKVSTLRTKDEWIAWIKMATQDQQGQIKQQQLMDDKDRRLGEMERLHKLEGGVMELEDKRREADVDQVIAGTLSNIAS